MNERKLYIGVKVIRAEPMTLDAFRRDFKWDQAASIEHEIGVAEGYLVEYPDGYLSWSPRATFEAAYRLVTDTEKELVSDA